MRTYRARPWMSKADYLAYKEWAGRMIATILNWARIEAAVAEAEARED